ncbi:TPA: HAMP domain-containing histidine kinase [Streptococcus suis]|nr:HAMP domain-containing histidine kinase [Streptococcus suis]
MQGRKGIGRYAANILGEELLLETVYNREESTVYINWRDFSKYRYLDEVDILTDVKKADKKSGTKLTITQWDMDEEYEWNRSDLDHLRMELKKLIPPVDQLKNEIGEFNIGLRTLGFEKQEDNFTETIKPFPIRDLYDYRISGKVDRDGNASLFYENQRKNSAKFEIKKKYEESKCGELFVDIRVYDRDSEGITALIQRGLKDELTGRYLSNNEARKLLTDANGIGVYRNGFRIRPLGDPENDWLRLNQRRVDNPSFRIGSNQVIGYVFIESEEKSGLQEQSARDGLKKNQNYKSLVTITQSIIAELETQRFNYRRNIATAQKEKRLLGKLYELSDYTLLEKEIQKVLRDSDVPQSKIDIIQNAISKEGKKKEKIVDDLNRAIAIYQGQATLGKIINVIMHEGRRPLQVFKNERETLAYWVDEYLNSPDMEAKDEIKGSTERIKYSTETFVTLFEKLDPLAAKKRGSKDEFNIYDVVNSTFKIFEKQFKKFGVLIELIIPKNVQLVGWKQDFTTIFANLIDNSLYWMEEQKTQNRKITVILKQSSDEMCIDYHDSGPGINEELIKSAVIFEPEFTGKSEGSGLGLPISGEAANRNGFSLTAIVSKNGAHFRLLNDFNVREANDGL